MQLPTTATDESTARTDAIRRFLDHGGLIDITTIGRRTGALRRIEIVVHNIDGRLVISGTPRREKRAWLANLEADPSIVVHVKGILEADLPGTARIVTDPTERRALSEWIIDNAWPRMDLDSMIAYSPMIEVTLDGDWSTSAH